jgi:hypothetical protein
MQITETRSTANVSVSYAVNCDVVGVKVVARINEPNVSANFTTILKSHNADLAYAAHPRIGRFKVNSDEAHSMPLVKLNCLLPEPVQLFQL